MRSTNDGWVTDDMAHVSTVLHDLLLTDVTRLCDVAHSDQVPWWRSGAPLSNAAGATTVPDMTYSGSYALVLALHLLTVAFLVGPAAVAGMSSARHARRGEAQALHAASRITRLCTSATILTVLLGTAMVGLGDVGDQWEMDQLWISASYALWFVASAVTLGFVVPTQRKAAKAIEDGGDGGALAGRIAAGAGLATLAWALVVVLMVVKPGA